MIYIRALIALILGIITYPILVASYSLFFLATIMGLGMFFISLLTWDKEEMGESLYMFYTPFIMPFILWKDYILYNKLKLE